MKIDKLELLGHGPIQIRYMKTAFTASGEEFELGQYHREVRIPGQDISDLPADTQATINAHWTTERVTSWEASQMDS